MDTVSYLTINDETKEIADIASRNDIQNIAATVIAHSNDIEYIQLETGPDGTLSNSISQAYSTAFAAQANAMAASEAAALADEKAVSATQAADKAWDEAASASAAANTAWDKAVSASISADVAGQKADEAVASAAVAESAANSATQASELAWNKATDASEAAELANHKADLASEAASAAQTDARRANTYANGALAGLSTLESVIDTVNWFSEHRTASTDTEVDPNKNYYTYDSSTGTMSKVSPWGSENPSEEGWYELDETIQNYVASHVAQTDDGLYVASTISGWRILVSTGTGNYTPGIFIVDPNGVIKQSIVNNETEDGPGGIQFDRNSPFYIGDENAYVVFDGNGHITIGGDGVDILTGVTIGESKKTLSQVLNDLGSAITSIQYGVSSSSTDHSDVERWSTETPEWEPGKYVWMRTTTNGQTYTYTCIQGAEGQPGPIGPQGEQGPQGLTGIGILSVEIAYAISDSGDVIPEDEAWKSSIDQWYDIYELEQDEEEPDTGEEEEPGTDEEPADESSIEEDLLTLQKGSWLWVRTTTEYSDFSSDVTYQKSYIGTDGQDGTSVFVKSSSKQNGVTTVTLIDSDGNETNLEIADGQDGANGVPGANGKNIHIAWADTITITQENGSLVVRATGFDTSNSTNKKYMGVYDSVDLADSDDPSDYNWSLIKGDKGDPGDPSYVYELLCDPSAIAKANLTDIPPKITFTSKRSQGTGNLADYPARFVISISEDGTTWTSRYTSSSDESVKQYIAPANTKFVKCELYLAGGTTTLIDTQTVPIISDGYQGEDGKILNIKSGVYLESELPNISAANEADAYLVDDGDGQYDLYYKGTGATEWTIVENWQGVAGPPGAPGAAGSDGYTVTLTNESHNFPAGTSAALASSTTCNIIAYKGTTQVPVSIGTISGEVTGLTTSITNNNSTSAGFTVSAANTLTTRSGVLTIPIVVDSKSFEKKFSWTLAIQGQKGDRGEKGDSVTISSNVTEYTSSTNGTTIPNSGWQSTVPSVAQGSYLWTKVTTTFSDSSKAVSYTTSRQGANGSNGSSVTVKSTEYAYQLSTSGTTPPTGEWKTSPQAPTTTQYAWTRTITTYSDNSTATTYTVGGKTGINGTSSYTYVRYGTNSSGAGMTATPTASTTYIGVYVGNSATAPTTANSYTWSRYVGEKGDKGDKGDPGQTGATGPEAIVTVTPTTINWATGTATLAATLRVNGVITTPTGYKWTKGTSADSLGTGSTLDVTDLNATYNCTVTW